MVPDQSISPNVTKYTAVGMLVGIFISCAIIVILSLIDTTISDEEYLIQNYDIPILAVIPELFSDKGSNYGYYNGQPYYTRRIENEGEE